MPDTLSSKELILAQPCFFIWRYMKYIGMHGRHSKNIPMVHTFTQLQVSTQFADTVDLIYVVLLSTKNV